MRLEHGQEIAHDAHPSGRRVEGIGRPEEVRHPLHEPLADGGFLFGRQVGGGGRSLPEWLLKVELAFRRAGAQREAKARAGVPAADVARGVRQAARPSK